MGGLIVKKFQLGGPQYFLGGLPNPQQSQELTRENLYKNIRPQGYSNFISRLFKGAIGIKEKDRDKATPQENAMWAKYLNLSPKQTGGLDWRDYLQKTNKRPSKGTINQKRPYYKIVKGPNPLTDDDYSKLENGQSTTVEGNGAGMGTYTISKGNDGTRSYHDIWDINPLRGVSSGLPASLQKYVPDIDFGKLIGATEYGIYDNTKN